MFSHQHRVQKSKRTSHRAQTYASSLVKAVGGSPTTVLVQGSRSAVGDPFEMLFTALLGDPSHRKTTVIPRAGTGCVITVYTAPFNYRSVNLLNSQGNLEG